MKTFVFCLLLVPVWLIVVPVMIVFAWCLGMNVHWYTKISEVLMYVALISQGVNPAPRAGERT